MISSENKKIFLIFSLILLLIIELKYLEIFEILQNSSHKFKFLIYSILIFHIVLIFNFNNNKNQIEEDYIISSQRQKENEFRIKNFSHKMSPNSYEKHKTFTTLKEMEKLMNMPEYKKYLKDQANGVYEKNLMISEEDQIRFSDEDY